MAPLSWRPDNKSHSWRLWLVPEAQKAWHPPRAVREAR
jgi:hypothetical protein